VLVSVHMDGAGERRHRDRTGWGMWNVEEGRVRLGVQVHVILRRVAARAMVGEVAERAVRVDYTPVRGPALELPGKPLIH